MPGMDYTAAQRERGLGENPVCTQKAGRGLKPPPGKVHLITFAARKIRLHLDKSSIMSTIYINFV